MAQETGAVPTRDPAGHWMRGDNAPVLGTVLVGAGAPPGQLWVIAMDTITRLRHPLGGSGRSRDPYGSIAPVSGTLTTLQRSRLT